MKSRIMFSPLSYVLLFFCLGAIAGCAKEGDDLTTAVVGRYLRITGNTALQVTVKKANNNTVTIAFISDSINDIHSSCTMNSTTSITLNEATGIDNTKNERYSATGTATLDGENLSITRHEQIFFKSTDELKREFDTTYVLKKRM